MKNLNREQYEINPFTADSSFNSDNRNGLRRFGYRHPRNGNACGDFHGIYATYTYYPSNVLHRFQSAEMDSYYCRNRVDFSNIIIIT